MFFQVPPFGERWNRAEATPEPPTSAEFDEIRSLVPHTVAPATGVVMEPVEGVLSTLTVNGALVQVVLKVFVVITRRS
jgi:hypothetical protein